MAKASGTKAADAAGAKSKPRNDRAQTAKTTTAPKGKRMTNGDQYAWKPIQRGTMHRR